MLSGDQNNSYAHVENSPTNGVSIKELYHSLFLDHEIYSDINKDYPINLNGIRVPNTSRLTPLNAGRVSFVDPATATLILEAASLFISLSQSDGRNSAGDASKVGEWIDKIDNQLHRVNLLLEDIRVALADLKVFIRQEFTRDTEIELLGYIETYVVNVAAYKNNPQSPALNKLMSDLYTPIQALSRKLMHYGYAPVVTVFYSHRIAIDLARILKVGAETEARISKVYYDYIDAAIDPAIPGSLANVFASTAVAAKELSDRFTPGDKGFVGPAWWYKDNKREVCSGHREGRECHEVWSQWRLHPGYRITGSIQSGFDGQSMDVGHVYADGSKEIHEYINGRGRAFDEATQYVREHILPEYNKASSSYNILINNANVIEAARSRCVEFKNLLEQFV